PRRQRATGDRAEATELSPGVLEPIIRNAPPDGACEPSLQPGFVLHCPGAGVALGEPACRSLLVQLPWTHRITFHDGARALRRGHRRLLPFRSPVLRALRSAFSTRGPDGGPRSLWRCLGARRCPVGSSLQSVASTVLRGTVAGACRRTWPTA